MGGCYLGSVLDETYRGIIPHNSPKNTIIKLKGGPTPRNYHKINKNMRLLPGNTKITRCGRHLARDTIISLQ